MIVIAARTGVRHLFSRLTISKPRPKPKGYPLKLQTVGDHIRKKRMDQGKTGWQVAEEIGVHKESIFNWESRNKNPEIHSYPGIIKYLGYDPWDTGGNSLKDRLGRYKRANGFSNKVLAQRIGCDESSVARVFKDLNVFKKTTKKIEKFLKEVSI